MKKFVLGFGLALLAAGCSNEVLVEEQQNPQEEVQTPISFATFADKQVRSQSVLMEDYHNTIAVYGVKKNVTVQTVFNNVTLSYTPGGTPNDWAYSPLRYWDKQADYEFIAFAPASAPMAYVLHTDGKVTGGHFQTSASYTLVGQNLQNGTSNEEIYTGFTGGTETGKDTDIMLASIVPANGTTKGIVNFDFHHILSKLNVAVKLNASLGSSVVKVKNITITGLKDTGTYTDAAGWSATVKEPNYQLQFNNASGVAVNATKALYFLESLVMPQAMAGTLNMEYTISTGGYSETYYYAQSLEDIFTTTTFDKGSNYTITFTISPSVITFDAKVSNWATGENAGVNIN